MVLLSLAGLREEEGEHEAKAIANSLSWLKKSYSQ
jgi:hypothetical protein